MSPEGLVALILLMILLWSISSYCYFVQGRSFLLGVFAPFHLMIIILIVIYRIFEVILLGKKGVRSQKNEHRYKPRVYVRPKVPYKRKRY